MTSIFDSFTLERRIAAPPATVFRAFADPALKARWFGSEGEPGWTTLDYALDFRVGGTEHGRWRLSAPGQPWDGEHENRTVYLDIVPDRRIVSAYTMALNGHIHSSSLATIRLSADGAGTRLDLTEQGVYHDGSDGPAGRRHGTDLLFDALSRSLTKDTP